MGMETLLFKSEEKKTKSDIANTLRIIADKIEQGQLTLRQDQVDKVDPKARTAKSLK